jgi:hypothetical protein
MDIPVQLARSRQHRHPVQRVSTLAMALSVLRVRQAIGVVQARLTPSKMNVVPTLSIVHWVRVDLKPSQQGLMLLASSPPRTRPKQCVQYSLLYMFLSVQHELSASIVVSNLQEKPFVE